MHKMRDCIQMQKQSVLKTNEILERDVNKLKHYIYTTFEESGYIDWTMASE